MLPKQTIKTNADGNNGEMRSINMPAISLKTLKDQYEIKRLQFER